jgi:hypothetical protein
MESASMRGNNGIGVSGIIIGAMLLVILGSSLLLLSGFAVTRSEQSTPIALVKLPQAR